MSFIVPGLLHLSPAQLHCIHANANASSAEDERDVGYPPKP